MGPFLFDSRPGQGLLELLLDFLLIGLFPGELLREALRLLLRLLLCNAGLGHALLELLFDLLGLGLGLLSLTGASGEFALALLMFLPVFTVELVDLLTAGFLGQLIDLFPIDRWRLFPLLGADVENDLDPRRDFAQLEGCRRHWFPVGPDAEKASGGDDGIGEDPLFEFEDKILESAEAIPLRIDDPASFEVLGLESLGLPLLLLGRLLLLDGLLPLLLARLLLPWLLLLADSKAQAEDGDGSSD